MRNVLTFMELAISGLLLAGFLTYAFGGVVMMADAIL